MSPDPVPSASVSRDDPARATRRAGYAIAIILNAGLLWIIGVHPGWQTFPIVTERAGSIIGWLVLALGVGIIVNAVDLLIDTRGVRALGVIITSVAGIALLLRVGEVFPFAFPAAAVDWSLIARAVIVIALLGSALSILISTISLIRILSSAGAARSGAGSDRERPPL